MRKNNAWGGVSYSKGLTLIELLAVIVILAIIALIATPIVLDIIDDSKASAKERSIENIERAAKLYIVSEYETKTESAPSVITIGELKSKGYIQNTDEDDNNKVFVYMNDTDYIFYYEGRDNLKDYKTLKSLIESDTKHIKKNVVVNGNTVNKVYGTKEEQTTMNNYVLYSGQLWEVIETNDTNNTIKLVSPVSLTAISYGTTNDWNSSWVKKWLNEYFYSKLERTDIIKETEFCIDPVDVTPDSYTKMTSCTNKITEKVGLLTYEDYIYAKDASTIQDGESYLDEFENSWLITPTKTVLNKDWYTTTLNYLSTKNYDTNGGGLGVRPVISIKDNVLVKGGKGTRSNPYILSSERSLKENTKLNLGKVGDYVYLDESNNPYVTEFTESYVNKVSNKTSTSKVRYRIVEINSDGSIKVERADVLRNLPNTISASSNIYISFYSIDTGEGLTSCLYSPEKKYGEETISVNNYYLGGCTNHNRFDLMEGEGEFTVNTGENLPYYLNNATNSFYNWYSDKTKSMIIPTVFKLTTTNYGRDYNVLDEDGEVILNVVLPSWGEMYTGNDLNNSYWLINRWENSLILMSIMSNNGDVFPVYISGMLVAVRPVITLSKNVYVTNGKGIANDPYSLDI